MPNNPGKLVLNKQAYVTLRPCQIIKSRVLSSREFAHHLFLPADADVIELSETSTLFIQYGALYAL